MTDHAGPRGLPGLVRRVGQERFSEKFEGDGLAMEPAVAVVDVALDAVGPGDVAIAGDGTASLALTLRLVAYVVDLDEDAWLYASDSDALTWQDASERVPVTYSASLGATFACGPGADGPERHPSDSGGPWAASDSLPDGKFTTPPGTAAAAPADALPGTGPAARLEGPLAGLLAAGSEALFDRLTERAHGALVGHAYTDLPLAEFRDRAWEALHP